MELPIRQKRFRFPGPRPLLDIGFGVVLLAVVVAFAAPKFSQPEGQTLEQSADELRNLPAPSAAGPGEVPSIGVFGDSTAVVVALGLGRYDGKDTTIHSGRGWAELGCTPSAPAIFINRGKEGTLRKRCEGWVEKWRTASDEGHMDAAVVLFGGWEVKPTKVEGDETFTVIGEDPGRDSLLGQRIAQGLDALSNTPLIIIMTSPYIEPGRNKGRPPAYAAPEADPARMDRVNEIILDVAGRYPNVAIVDLAKWMNESEEDNRLRPDGIHFSTEVALELAPRFAATFAAIVNVFRGGQAPEDTSGILPVLRYITPLGTDKRL